MIIIHYKGEIPTSPFYSLGHLKKWSRRAFFLIRNYMANGKKNYFRHSFFARNDIKLRNLRDKVGIGFYFYFFSLLEQCGEECADNFSEKFCFHDSIIRSLWCVNLKKSERVANEMMSVGLLFFEKRENTFYFEIPNFVKYLGKYENKIQSNTSKEKKEKEKKRKENNIKSENSDEIDLIIFYLNEKTGANYKHETKKTRDLISRLLKNNFSLDEIKSVIDKKSKEWNSTEMEKYLRPETLFGNKFEGYLNQKEKDEFEKLTDEQLFYKLGEV